MGASDSEALCGPSVPEGSHVSSRGLRCATGGRGVRADTCHEEGHHRCSEAHHGTWGGDELPVLGAAQPQTDGWDGLGGLGPPPDRCSSCPWTTL